MKIETAEEARRFAQEIKDKKFIQDILDKISEAIVESCGEETSIFINDTTKSEFNHIKEKLTVLGFNVSVTCREDSCHGYPLHKIKVSWEQTI